MANPEENTLHLSLRDVEDGTERKASIPYPASGPLNGVAIVLPGFETMTGDRAVVWIEYRKGIPYVIVYGKEAQEEPTHTISLAEAAVSGARCPTEPRFEGDMQGCGSLNVGTPDDEGYRDCYDCGLFFMGDYAAESIAITQRLDLLQGNS